MGTRCGASSRQVRERPRCRCAASTLCPNVLEGIRCLYEQLRAVQPLVVVACGNYALWALTNCTSWSTPAETEGRRVPSGIMSVARKSMVLLTQWRTLAALPLVPLIHPAAILSAWYNRAVTIHDLRERVRLQGLSGRLASPDRALVSAPPTFTQASGRPRRSGSPSAAKGRSV